MNQIKSFDDQITQEILMTRFKHLAEDIAKEFGVEIDRVSNINANYNLLTFNVAFKVKSPKPQTRTHSSVYGTGKIDTMEIKEGFKFRMKTHTFVITGFNLRNYKNCVSMKRDDGKLFKISFDKICQHGERV